MSNVCCGSLAALLTDISLTSASGGKAATRHPDFPSLRLNVCFSRKRTFSLLEIAGNQGPLSAAISTGRCNTCRASSYDAPTKPSGPKTRMLGFKRMLRRPIEITRGKRTFSDSISGVPGIMSAFLQSGRFYPDETPIFRGRFRLSCGHSPSRLHVLPGLKSNYSSSLGAASCKGQLLGSPLSSTPFPSGSLMYRDGPLPSAP